MTEAAEAAAAAMPEAGFEFTCDEEAAALTAVKRKVGFAAIAIVE